MPQSLEVRLNSVQNGLLKFRNWSKTYVEIKLLFQDINTGVVHVFIDLSAILFIAICNFNFDCKLQFSCLTSIKNHENNIKNLTLNRFLSHSWM
jgi:hypothetical protein